MFVELNFLNHNPLLSFKIQIPSFYFLRVFSPVEGGEICLFSIYSSIISLSFMIMIKPCIL